MIDPVLRGALEGAARQPMLIVACDYDGTLSPIVEDPTAATPHDDALRTLFSIADIAGVQTAIVSGRSSDMLRLLTDPPETVTLVGDHGANAIDGPDPDAHAELAREMAVVADRFTGAEAEHKSLGVALHYRRALDQEGAAAAAHQVARRFDARVIDGKKVVEVVLAHGDKGTAVEALRRRWSADAVVFFGDDTTDEDVFAVLGDNDVGVKVGEGETGARFRVDDPDDVAAALDILHAALQRLG